MTEAKTYDVHNPLKNRRVIFDGIENKTPIGIDPGETRRGVVLADHVAEKLLAQSDDLQLTEAKPGASVNLSPPSADAGIETVAKAPPPRPPQHHNQQSRR